LPVEPKGVKPIAPAGTIEIHIGRSVVRVDGVVDADTLRTVLGSLRS
jgi:transposase